MIQPKLANYAQWMESRGKSIVISADNSAEIDRAGKGCYYSATNITNKRIMKSRPVCRNSLLFLRKDNNNATREPLPLL